MYFWCGSSKSVRFMGVVSKEIVEVCHSIFFWSWKIIVSKCQEISQTFHIFNNCLFLITMFVNSIKINLHWPSNCVAGSYLVLWRTHNYCSLTNYELLIILQYPTSMATLTAQLADIPLPQDGYLWRGPHPLEES